MKTLVFAQKRLEQAPKTTKTLFVFSQIGKEHAPKTPKRFYTFGRSKDLGQMCPVLENTSKTAVATSTVKRGFVSSKFWGLVHLCQAFQVTGEMGLGYPQGRSLSARTPARLFTCFQHLVHPMRLKTQTVGSQIQTGIKTMTAITQQASRAAAQICAPSTTGTIPTSNISAVLAAFNAANMAASYVERGNFVAARRKLTQALASINQITLEA